VAEDKKEQEDKTSNKKKIPLWLYLPFAVVFIGACAGAYLFGVSGGANPLGSNETVTEKDKKKKETLGPMIELDDFVVNILDGEQMHYLKASITIEVNNGQTKGEVENRNPQIRDAIILLMGNKKYNELRDLQGKLQLRAELQQRINSLLPQGQVENIYFTEFVVQ